ncbi:MAG TPA: peptide ABC transporter substrate-binding protein [Thermomicrobiales bacterium]|jgi:peptide/nickel transport system substrate-binding protein|nr:peptide ABC transporter substrate-binding protein [Thermomicrobiales bacterium]
MADTSIPSQRAADSGLSDLFLRLNRGEISRRQFLAAGAATGAGLGMLQWLVRAAQTAGATPHPQDATPAPGATPTAVAPAVGTEGKTRGQDGELRLLFWQAVTGLSPHIANGTTNIVASQLVTEPLMRIFEDGSIQPNLLSEVPSQANGGINAELTEITFRLQPGVVWSDGTPFTADDVVFTHQWVTDPANGALSSEPWARISEITAVDDLTVVVRYPQLNLNWYEPFATQQLGAIYPKHYVEAGGDMQTAPIGTGPFVVDSFASNDQIIFSANASYRDPNKPYFATVNLRGGGDVATAVQSVVQTGDWDYVWNVQLEPDLITEFTSNGVGQVRAQARTTIERINFNLSDPRAQGPDGQLSYWQNPHPILSDRAVRQAISLGIDRQLILDRLYNPEGERLTGNIITGNPQWESPNVSNWAYDPDQANQILDDAGWERNGEYRAKDGVTLRLDLSTSINSVRQNTQIIVQQQLRAIGIQLDLQQVDAGIFFSSDPGNTQNLRHFYNDTNMYSSGAPLSLPITYMNNWYTGPNGENMAQASNGWAGTNTQRYNNPAYDAEWEALNSGAYTTIEEAAQSIIRLNDFLVADYICVPLVNRAAGSGSYAIHNSLIHGEDKVTGEDNYGTVAFDDGFWNIANWNRSEPVSR